MVTIRHSHSLPNPKNDTESCIFPPVNHENLQILSHNNNQQQHPSSKSSPPRPSLSLSPCDLSSEKVVNGWLDYGLEVLRTKICSFISLIGNKDGASKGAFWTFGRVAGIAVVVMWWWWWLCRRRRKQRERVEHLQLIIKEKDEKILQLLRQIAQMNEVLVGRHKVLASKVGN
ncbi:uncharacterized protein LOC116113907 [Pistacia vera]|uniref:uncharacterized protein LOC116113907 n=1 Tax=Pistacia vera TaxID=55513 RepID=UPI001262E4BD|nr:uncharacterized protein LOC116113907 [Pistacia vera]